MSSRWIVTRFCYKGVRNNTYLLFNFMKGKNMAASVYRRLFSLNKNENSKREEEHQYDVARYDDTYTVVKDVLQLVGLRVTRNDSPFVRFCWNAFYWFEFLNLFMALVLELINMGETAQGGSLQDAIEIFRMMPCVGYLLLAMCKSYKIVYYRDIYENLIEELRAMWPQGNLNEEQRAIIKRDLGQLNTVIKGYYWCNNFLMLVFLTPPFMEILKRAMGQEVPLILPFFYWFPIDPFQRVYYEVILAFQTWHGLITIWFMLSGDLLFCIFMSHITTQFDLLSARIKKLIYVPLDHQLPSEFPLGSISEEMAANSKDAMDSYSTEDWEKQHQRDLIRIIGRHRALIRLAGDVEELFTFALLVNFFNSSIIICFCGFCCVIVEKWNEMVYKSFLTTALSQTWLLCWYGQRLQESSVGVSHALYNSGWYQASKKLKSSIYIILHRAQKEVHVTTYGFSVVCLASYTTIIKSSWSYFTLLLNVYKQPNK